MSALTSLLVRDGVVPVRKIEEALQRQVISGGDVETVLLELGVVSENLLASYRASLYGVPAASSEEVMSVPHEVVRLVPAEVAIEHRLVPIALRGTTLDVAVREPLSPDQEERLGFLLGYTLATRVVCEVRIAAALAHHYGAELLPRFARLIDRIRKRDPGVVAAVETAAGPHLASHGAELPYKGDLDASPFERRTRVFGSGPLDPAPLGRPRRGTDPGVGDALDRVEPPFLEERRPPVASLPEDDDELAEPLEAPIAAFEESFEESFEASFETSPSARSGDARWSEPAGSEEPPASPRGSGHGLLKLVRGPLTLAGGERLLKRASNRDQILEVLVSFARQFFDYTALFVVGDEAADGREAWGVGASTEEIRSVSVPLDGPSVFAEARRTRAPQVRRLGGTEIDREAAAAMRRANTPMSLILPIAIRQRVVLLVYGDRDGEEFELGAVMELVRFASRVVEAFEQLILRRKRVGYEGADSGRDERSSLKRAAQTMAETAGRARPDVLRSRGGSGSWRSGRSAPEPLAEDSWSSVEETPETPARLEGVPPIGGSDSAVPAPVSAPPVAPPISAPPVAPPVSAPPVSAPPVSAPPVSAPPVSAPPVSAPPVSAPPPHSADALPSEVLGIARREPPPPPAALDLVDIDLAASGLAAAVAAAEAELAAADDEPEVTFDSGDEDDDFDGMEDIEEEAPLPRARVEGTYRLQHAAVDVVRPSRASDRPRPVSSRPMARDPRREGDGAPPSDVTRSVRPPSVTRSRSEPSSSRGLDVETRSVIVDMGEQVHAQVEDLVAAASEEQRAVLIRGLLQLGEAALPALVQAFPGPLHWDRSRSKGTPPPGREISVVARALVAFGERAVPYVASLLGSGHPDVRYYAALLVAELVHPELMNAVAARVHDSDAGVRRLACALLPRFAGYREFEEVRTVLRRTARLRGKVLARRWQAVDALAVLRDVEALDRLIELLREPDEELVDHTLRALMVLTATDHGRSYRRWASWYEKHKAEHRMEWLIEGLLHGEESIRALASSELERLTQELYGYQASAPKKDRERAHRRYREWWEDEGRRRYGPG